MPQSPYGSELLRLANEMELLEFDLQQASTLFTQQACLKRMFEILQYLMHHTLIETGVVQPPQSQQPQAPARAPAAPATQTGMVQAATRPGSGRPLLANRPAVARGVAPATEVAPRPAPSGVAEVVMTRDGVEVIPPAGSGAAPVKLPPGTPVDATFGQQAPARPRPTTLPVVTEEEQPTSAE